jgi:7,8-dihydro-6-hydroxymethylpterin-pyrophosphokinase
VLNPVADGQAEAVGTEHDRSLSVPHKRWQERSFVKAPLADLACGGFRPCPASALHCPQAARAFVSRV